MQSSWQFWPEKGCGGNEVWGATVWQGCLTYELIPLYFWIRAIDCPLCLHIFTPFSRSLLLFQVGDIPLFKTHLKSSFLQVFTSWHQGARIILPGALLMLLCCGSPTALCQIICMCVSPTRSSTRGGQKPNGNLCFTSFGTEPFLALSRHSINILESLKCKLIQIGFFLKGSEDQVLRRMNGVQWRW